MLVIINNIIDADKYKLFEKPALLFHTIMEITRYTHQAKQALFNSVFSNFSCYIISIGLSEVMVVFLLNNWSNKNPHVQAKTLEIT